MIVLVSCGGTAATGQAEWDGYKNQIDSWRVQVDEKLAEADGLLGEGPSDSDNGEWLTSLQALGVDIDSITFAASTVHPPHELEDFHDSFTLASDFYRLIGRLFTEFTGVTQEEREFLRAQIATESAFGDQNIIAAQTLFDEEAEKRDR